MQKIYIISVFLYRYHFFILFFACVKKTGKNNLLIQITLKYSLNTLFQVKVITNVWFLFIFLQNFQFILANFLNFGFIITIVTNFMKVQFLEHHFQIKIIKNSLVILFHFYFMLIIIQMSHKFSFIMLQVKITNFILMIFHIHLMMFVEL